MSPKPAKIISSRRVAVANQSEKSTTSLQSKPTLKSSSKSSRTSKVKAVAKALGSAVRKSSATVKHGIAKKIKRKPKVTSVSRLTEVHKKSELVKHNEIFASNQASGKQKEKPDELPLSQKKLFEKNKLAHEKISGKVSLDPTAQYMHEIGFKPLLSVKDELKTARAVQRGSKKARKVMIESNLRLVVKIARSFINRGMPVLDLISDGNLGLIKAIEKFDPERGFRFSTYATWWIRQTIERSIMNTGRTIRVPVHVLKEMNVYLRAGKELSKKLDHEPTIEEISELIDKPIEEIHKLMKHYSPATSLDTPLSDDTATTVVDTVGTSEPQNPAAMVEDIELMAHVQDMVRILDARSQEVLRLRFGLDDKGSHTLEEVAFRMMLTKERVRQIQVAAMEELKGYLHANGINEDLMGPGLDS